MTILELVSANLLSPIVLAFALGVIAARIRSDLRFPEELYSGLTIYLLLAIGMKGGVELSETRLADVWLPALGALAIGVATPFWCVAILHRIGGFDRTDSAAIAAHYGSVSVVTFIATTTFLEASKVPYEGFAPSLVALLEVPAIIVALLLANTHADGPDPKERRLAAMREVVTGRSIVLLVGGLAIGWISGKKGIEPVAPFFQTMFRGALTLFLLEMGMVTAKRLADLRKVGPFLVGFAVIVPILHGALGAFVGTVCGLSLGGTTVLAALAASASYIAAPAAVRIALPRANPTFYLTAALVVTFPFNLAIGIPLYHEMARWMQS